MSCIFEKEQDCIDRRGHSQHRYQERQDDPGGDREQIREQHSVDDRAPFVDVEEQ